MSIKIISRGFIFAGLYFRDFLPIGKMKMKDPRSLVPIGYSLVSYLKVAGGHAHTDCNSPFVLVAALYETLISNDNFKSALPLTILADLPFCVLCNRMALSKCGTCATLIECSALSISGLIIIAGFTSLTFLMSNYLYTPIIPPSWQVPALPVAKKRIIHIHYFTKLCCNLESCGHEKYFWNAILLQGKSQSGVRKPTCKQQLKVIYSQFIFCGFLACLHLCCD